MLSSFGIVVLLTGQAGGDEATAKYRYQVSYESLG
jgi:hypothetical protein